MRRLHYHILFVIVILLSACSTGTSPKTAVKPTVRIPTVELLIAPPAEPSPTPWLSPMAATMKAYVEAEHPDVAYGVNITAEPQNDSRKPASGSFEPVIVGDFRLDYRRHWREKCLLSSGECVIIEYRFTNNGSKTESFMFATHRQAFQGGVELEYSSSVGDEVMTDIRPGASVIVKDGYELRNNDPVIELEFEPLFEFFSEKVTRTITLR